MRNYAALPLLLILNCISIGEPDREPSRFPMSGHVYRSWEQVLQGSTPISEFEVLHTGEVEVPVTVTLETDGSSTKHNHHIRGNGRCGT